MARKIKDDSHVNSEGAEHQPVIPRDAEQERIRQELLLRKEEARKKMGNYVPLITTLSGEKKYTTELNVEEQEVEIIRCTKDPIYFIETYLTIFDQTIGDAGKIVPFKLFPFQKDLINAYLNEKFTVTNKYRQAGISTCTCAFISHHIAFNENRVIAVVADKLETAQSELMKDVVDFLEGCPKWLVPQPTKKDTQKYKIYSTGCELKAFATNSLRGYTPTLLFWDETAWAEKGEKFWTAARPTLQTGGKAIFVSCVTKDSFVFTENGIKQIKDFIKSEELGGHFIDNVNLLGIHKTRKTNIIFNNGYVDTFKIKTSYSELESSENHKYWAYKNGEYNWVKASDLNNGDYISIQKGMNIWGNNDDCSDFKPTKSNKIKNPFKPKKITKDIAYLIGLYISEGSCIIRNNRKHTYYGITLTCGDDITNVLNLLDLPYYYDNNLHYTISSIQLADFLQYLGFDLSKKAPKKIIPSRLLEMSKDNMVAMMQGIMDGDGWACYENKENRLKIGIGLSSLELIKQIRIILNNFGVLTQYKNVLTPITEKVKVESIQHRLIANNEYAKKYFDEIGFRLKRKNNIINNYDRSKLKHIGVYDNIPNGSEIIKEIYNSIKYYGFYKKLNKHNINVKDIVQKNKNNVKSCSRKTILNLINLEKDRIPNDILEKYKYVLNKNIVWTKIKTIEKSKNFTYDFSMSKDNEKEQYEHEMSIIYNGLITHNTPNSHDPIFYKSFINAKNKGGDGIFYAVELWWYNDPRYTRNEETGEFDLEWVKNKDKQNEIRLKDEHWSHEKRAQMVEDGWEATSSWFEKQVKGYNGDMRKLAQEILGSFLGSGDNFIAEEYIKRIEENEVKTPIRQEYIDMEMWIWEDPLPDEEYVMSIDVSAGHGDDYSSINIFKIKEIIEDRIIRINGVSKKKKTKLHKLVQVAEYYNKVRPQTLGEIAYLYGEKYNFAYCIVDIGGGYGTQTIDKLMEKGYPNIHYSEITHKPSRDKLSGYVKVGQKIMPDGKMITVDLLPGFLIGQNRGSILTEMQRAINLEDITIRSMRLLNELKTFINKSGGRVAEHKRSFHDDSIISMACAVYVVNFQMTNFKKSQSKTKKMLNSFFKLEGDEVLEKVDKTKINNENNQNYRIAKKSPYGANAWLFKGMK